MPRLIDRTGQTEAGDLKLWMGWGGVYFCFGRLDGGVNFTGPSRWSRRWQVTPSTCWAVLGPFDLRWTRRDCDHPPQ